MKITNIKVLERKNLGGFSHREIELSGVIDDGESESAAIKRLSQFVSWHLNLPERSAEYDRQKKILADESSDDKAKAKATLYIAKFEEAQAEVESK